MATVHILPAAEADRIAAGEVVERPASVVRELVENALDAGAGRIVIDIEDGGLERIRVADDGHGMAADDAELALHRHATSKIACLDDLMKVTTLGFRGEALPSIASVARLTIETSGDTSGEGLRLQVEAGKVVAREPCSRPRGTTITVENLFFNTPARRKFLKKAAAEFTRISDMLLPEMLSHYGVACRLAHGERVSFDLAAAADLRERVAGFWGARFAGDLIPLQRDAADMQVHGLISGPDETRGSRRNWHLFVNGRPVRDPLLIHATGEGMAGVLPKGRYPLLFLFLELPGDAVDVNVHPAKSEVRFADRAAVFALVRSSVRKALAPAEYLAHGSGTTPQAPSAGDSGIWQVAEKAGPESGVADLAGGRASQATQESGILFPGTSALPAVVSEGEQAEGGLTPAESLAPPVVLAQYRDCFIVAHDGEALYMLDQHAAHERVLYEELRDMYRRRESPRQALLFPRTCQIDPGHEERLEELIPTLDRLGFSVELFGEDALMVRQVPARLPESRAFQALEDLIPLLLESDHQNAEEDAARLRLEHKVAATLACHAAVRIHDTLTHERMNEIVQRWQKCTDPLTCPHGRTAVVRWPHGQILSAFGRP